MSKGLLGILSSSYRVVAAAERRATHDARRSYGFQQRLLREEARKQERFDRAQRNQERRIARDAREQERELRRRAKEQAQLNELEHARLMVETFENRCEVLTSAHKDPLREVDWTQVATLLAPLAPIRKDANEFTFRLQNSLLFEPGASQGITPEQQAGLSAAQALDTSAHEAELANHAKTVEETRRLAQLGRRILDRDPVAFKEALDQFAQPDDTDDRSYRLEYQVTRPELAECMLHVPGLDIIPSQLHSLSNRGRLQTREMPRKQRCDVYREHVCGCAIHWILQVFSMVPVDSVLMHVHAPVNETATGQSSGQCILSIWMPRQQAEAFDLESDAFLASTAVSASTHHGEFRRMRPSNELVPVLPLGAHDVERLVQDAGLRTDLDDLMRKMGGIRTNFINRHIEEREGADNAPSEDES